MKKIALLLVLFLGGCAVLNLDRPFYHRSEVETPDPTPSAALVSLIGGAECIMLTGDDNSHNKEITISISKISDDTTTVLRTDLVDLVYIEGGNNWGKYEGKYAASGGGTTTTRLWLGNLVLENDNTLTGDFHLTSVYTHNDYPHLDFEDYYKGSFTHTK